MIKRDATDAIFSDVIREAYDWRCAYYGTVFPERKGFDCQCSHFYSRRYLSTRWHPDNALCLSAAAHKYLGEHPDEHTELIRKELGDVRYFELRQRHQRQYRYRADDKKAIRAHYRAELERIKALRERGVVGRIEVVAYD